jgi:creatinine amidohydrolase/Fe(II)-dependent formamide hydrolase-like protein
MDSAKDHTHEVRVRVSTFSTIIDEAMYPEAVLGKATKASPEKGRQFLEAVAEEIASEIQKTLQVLSKPSEP